MSNDKQTTSGQPLRDAAYSLIRAGAQNIMCAGTTMGAHAHELMYQNLRGDFGKDICDPRWFNDGFPYRIWRDSGVGFALGRNRPEYSIDGQARTPEEAVEIAGPDGVIVTANSKSDSQSPEK